MALNGLDILTLDSAEGSVRAFSVDSSRNVAYLAQDILEFSSFNGLIIGTVVTKSILRIINLPGLAVQNQIFIDEAIVNGVFDPATDLFYVVVSGSPLKLIKISVNGGLTIIDTLSLSSQYNSPNSIVIDKANQKMYISVRDGLSSHGIIVKIDLVTFTEEDDLDIGVSVNLEVVIDESRGFLYALGGSTTYKVSISSFSVVDSGVFGSALVKIAIDISRNILYLGDSHTSLLSNPPVIKIYKADADTMTGISSRQIVEFSSFTGGEITTNIAVNELDNVIYVSAANGSGSPFFDTLSNVALARIPGDTLVPTSVKVMEGIPGGARTIRAFYHNGNYYSGNTVGGFNTGSGSIVRFNGDTFNQSTTKVFALGDQAASAVISNEDTLFIGGTTGTMASIDVARFIKAKGDNLRFDICYEAGGYVLENDFIYSILGNFIGDATAPTTVFKINASTLETVNSATITGTSPLAGLSIKNGFLYGGTANFVLGSESLKIRKIDIDDLTLAATLTIGGNVNIIAGFAGKDEFVYFLGQNGIIYRVNTNSFTLAGTLSIGGGFTFISNVALDRINNKAYCFPSSGVVKVNLSTMSIEGTLPVAGRSVTTGVIDSRNKKLYFTVLETSTLPVILYQVDLNTFTIEDEIEIDGIGQLYSAGIDLDCGVAYFASFNGPISILKVSVTDPLVTIVDVVCEDGEKPCPCVTDAGNPGTRCVPFLVVRKGSDIGSIIREECGNNRPIRGESDSAYIPPIVLCNRRLALVKRQCSDGKIIKGRCK